MPGFEILGPEGPELTFATDDGGAQGPELTMDTKGASSRDHCETLFSLDAEDGEDFGMDMSLE